MIPDIFNSSCINCKFLITFDLPSKGYNPFAQYTPICKAFPDGIPIEILRGQNKHLKPLELQGNEIIYQPTENEDENATKFTRNTNSF